MLMGWRILSPLIEKVVNVLSPRAQIEFVNIDIVCFFSSLGRRRCGGEVFGLGSPVLSILAGLILKCCGHESTSIDPYVLSLKCILLSPVVCRLVIFIHT